MSNYQIFTNLRKTYSLCEISTYLGLHEGTLKRWEELKEVPPQYYFDLCRMSNIVVDYNAFSYKEKDQFFTSKSTASYCFNKTIQVLQQLNVDIKEYTLIEPSAGDGSFYNLFPKDNRIGIDIEPKCDGVIELDFLTWIPEAKNNICIGNPPFGLRGNLALKFINHASEFSDFVCFILPQLFDSNGKGSCKSRVKNLNLIYSESIPSDFYYPDGKDVKVNVVFQIWSKHYKKNEDKIDLTNIVKLYSLSDGGTPSSTRNKKQLYNCDYYLPSTCFGKETMKLYDDFESLPHRRGYGIVIKNHNSIIKQVIKNIDWATASFESTNGAYNLRFDIIEKNIWNNLPENLKSINTHLDSFFI